MPNDAKLGLLAGVIGVIVAASISLSRPPSGAPPPTQAAAPTEKTVAEDSTKSEPLTSEDQKSDLTASPVVRTKKDTAAMPASRKPGNDDIDP